MSSASPTSSFRRRRALTAEATRAAIVDSAARLFLSRGYTGTSLAAIAGDAGVVVQTIYNSVGSKAALLSAVIDALAAGERSPTPVPVFLAERMESASDAAAVVDLLAEWLAEVNPRMAPLWAVIAEAAATDAEVGELRTRRDQSRLRNYAHAAELLRRRHSLAENLADEEAAAIIWSIGHPATFRALVLEAGWTVDAYRAWMASTLGRALLRPRPPVRG